MSERLRLKAEDGDDLSVIAACLQDALIPLSEMVYLAEERRFLAAFTRFRRECLADPAECAGLTQVNAVLAFSEVEAVHHLRPRQPLRRGPPRAPDDDRGAGRGRRRATSRWSSRAMPRSGCGCASIAATLADFGEPSPAPVPPAHDLAPPPREGR